jgi:hypothetical protein
LIGARNRPSAAAPSLLCTMHIHGHTCTRQAASVPTPASSSSDARQRLIVTTREGTAPVQPQTEPTEAWPRSSLLAARLPHLASRVCPLPHYPHKDAIFMGAIVRRRRIEQGIVSISVSRPCFLAPSGIPMMPRFP